MLDASSSCCRGPCSSEQKLREHITEQAVPFCPEYSWDEKLQGNTESDETRLRREAVNFAVTVLGGLADFVEDVKVDATDKHLKISARFDRIVQGEVATRSKLPVIFEVGRTGRIGLSIKSEPGCARLEIDQDSLFSLPVEGAVDAGNRFFAALVERGQGIGKITPDHTERVAESAVDWWESAGAWEGAGRGDEFDGTKISMIYDVAAKSKYGSVVPKSGLGSLLLGSLCVTPKEYRAFEWFVAKPDGRIVTSCDCFDAADIAGPEDRFPTWRNGLAGCIEDVTITRAFNRKMAEKFAASATSFVCMRVAKGLGLRMADCKVVSRLFTPCRCPSTAKQWDLMAQDWQKQVDITYSCAGDSEGRIVWRKSKHAPHWADGHGLADMATSPEGGRLAKNGMLCCVSRQLGGSPMRVGVGCMGDSDPSERDAAFPCCVANKREAEVMAVLQKRVAESDVLRRRLERHRGGEAVGELLLRFARARPRSGAAAVALLEADMEFRDSQDIAKLAATSAEDVLAKAVRAKAADPNKVDGAALLAAYQACFPHGLLGRDRSGHLVMYKALNKTTDFYRLAQLGMDTPTLVQYHLWMTERLLHATAHRGQWTVVFDLKGVPLKEFNHRGLGYTHQLMKIDSQHYPERLYQCFVINAPSFLATFWRRMGTWIDAKTRQKIHLLAGPEHWSPLDEAFDRRILPVHLGGETKLSLDGLCPGTGNSRPCTVSVECDVVASGPQLQAKQGAMRTVSHPATGATLRMVLVAVLAVLVAVQVQAHVAG